MENLNNLLKRLLEADIDFVLIGGYAAVVHGATQLTRDLDVCAVLTPEQITKLRNALKDIHPKHRMNPTNKISFLEKPVEGESLNALYLETDEGVLDIISTVDAVGSFDEIKKTAVEIEVFGHNCAVISLEALIQSKESMGRDKDKSILGELKSIQQQADKA